MYVFIAYGWPEGRWHGKQFIMALQNSGYQVTQHPEDADIIVAHSAGCYMLPTELNTKVILLIGLPNWPNKPLIKCTYEKVSLERKDTYWFKKTFWHAVYAISRPVRLYNVYKTYKRKYISDFSQNQTVLIRNNQDTYMQEEVSKVLANERKWPFLQLEGQHDDLWQNAQTYIQIIDKHLKTI